MTDYSCYTASLCTTDIETTEMLAITCPHQKYRCGISSPEIMLYLDQTLELEIDVSNNLGPSDSCYYHLYANDQVTESELEGVYNDKYL
jgi:hypothetical protein